MSNFMDGIKSTLNNECNVSVTENGAVGFRTTGKALLDTYQVPYASVYGEIVRTDGGGGRRQAKSVLAVSFVPLALTLKKLQTVSSV